MPKDDPSAYTRHVGRIARETVEVNRRLRRKYPQMYEPGWGKPKKKKGLLQRLKRKVTPRTATARASAASQLSEREELGKELEKLRRKSSGK